MYLEDQNSHSPVAGDKDKTFALGGNGLSRSHQGDWVGSSVGRAAPNAFGVGAARVRVVVNGRDRDGLVAQSVEQRPFKPLVPGSSPGQPTSFGLGDACALHSKRATPGNHRPPASSTGPCAWELPPANRIDESVYSRRSTQWSERLSVFQFVPRRERVQSAARRTTG
jgi:hypothetical protein